MERSNQDKAVQLVECPRDAMQGWKHFIPTPKKIAYINALLRVGFHTLDFGSFVSPRAIPQMADTKEVLKGLDLAGTNTKLLAIVANPRGAEEAAAYEEISYLGFPFSISPTFQMRNTNSTMEESLKRLDEIQAEGMRKGKELVVYLSMGFGNPYGDAYDQEILLEWAGKMVQKGVGIISLADTVGLASPRQVSLALNTLIAQYPGAVFGAHLHSTHDNWKPKLEAAISAGCRRIDGALKGIGGCPMAQDELVGNMDSEKIIDWLEEKHMPTGINREALASCLTMTREIFI